MDKDSDASSLRNHPVVSQERWLAERRQLLAREKELTHLRDRVAAERRALPWVRIDKAYSFDTPQGRRFVAVSRAPLAEIERFRRRMGWKFKWVSSSGSDFNPDFHVSFKPPAEKSQAKEQVYYNYSLQPFECEELPGISVFYRDDASNVFHTYSTYRRGVEAMMGAYNLLDLTPRGRDERNGPMAWVRHHDRYEPA